MHQALLPLMLQFLYRKRYYAKLGKSRAAAHFANEAWRAVSGNKIAAAISYRILTNFEKSVEKI